MATYINYGEGEDDAVVQGAEWLQNVLAQKGGPEAEKAFAEKFAEINADSSNPNYDSGPVFNLFLDHSKELFDVIVEPRLEDRSKEVESFFALVLSTLLLLEDQDELDKATTRLCDIFSSDTTQQPELRLRLLMTLYNTYACPTFEFRYRVFKYVVDFSAKAKLFDQVVPYLEYLDEWMKDWDTHLTVQDKRVLFSDLSRYMRALNKRIESFLYLKRYHGLFQKESKDALASAEVVQATVDLLKDAIQLPAIIQYDDILAFDTVKALAKGKSKELVELCEVFLTGSVNDLRAFQTKNPKFFDTYDLSFEESLSKIRLLTLATLAHGRAEINLEEVAKVLDESEDNVERWVVRAISEGVIDGRIDQLGHKLLVKSTFQRTFEKKEWSFLDSKLTQWVDNLENVIKFIGEQKAMKDGLAA